MRNSHNHRYNPHMHTIKEPAHRPRSDTINSMQAVDDAGVNGGAAHPNLAQPLSKDHCASAESSTCSMRRAELHALEPPIKPTNHSSASNISDYHTPGALITAMVTEAGACGTNVRVCCMCGDSGIAELLFACWKCSHRHQHMYCSRSYPSMGDETSICNWCLHEEDSMTSIVTKASDTILANNITMRAPAVASPSASLTEHHGHQKGDLTNQVLEKLDEEVMVKKGGHSKAFEYLLLVAAAQSTLRHQDNRAIGSNIIEIKQENQVMTCPINSTRASDPAAGKVTKGPEIIKPSNATPLVNIVNVGPNVEDKPKSSPHNINKLNVSLGTHQNMRIQNPIKISIGHKNIDVGQLIGSSIPKRQRCNKGINTSLKCRKKGLQLSPSRPNYRRYKLLADVVC
ncbi:hypothetical protein GOP47_0027431 [Adiantum capillus-veneris]|nr:hypothetical protein GOP47_0027431 [Adiantum capillus-veneris]